MTALSVQLTEPARPAASADIQSLLAAVMAAGASDLHLTVNRPPMIRLHGELQELTAEEPLSPAQVTALLRQIPSDEQWERFLRDQELDMAYAAEHGGRFRVNLFIQRGSPAAVLRQIPQRIERIEDLGLPSQVSRLAYLPRGLVLVTGPTGSGKTTTLASLLDLANRTRRAHIVTIEDPIEFVHAHRKCVVNQREVGVDTASFAVALRQVLRQDPDIILVGELRDLETMSVALTAAETGHLVLATLHTQSAAQTIDRIIDIFPPMQQQEIRAQLSTALQGVLTQALVKRSDMPGRTVVTEVMFVNAAIRNLIREGKNHQIPMMIQAAAGEGMMSFDQHLAQRVHEGLVDYNDALELCHEKDEFVRLAGRA